MIRPQTHYAGLRAIAILTLLLGSTACTDGGTNPTPIDPPAETFPWPTPEGVVTGDASGTFGANLSDLAYEAPSGSAQRVIWGVRNSPGTLFRLIWNGTIWTQDQSLGWGSGKALRYPGGTGEPDAEGLTYATGSFTEGIYVVAERSNDAKSTSRNSILRFDVSGTGTTLAAVNDWDLTSDLPSVDPNLGLEGVTWIPDSWLVSHGFMDLVAGHLYAPSEYPNHGNGLLLVGLESTGDIYLYALNHGNNSAHRVASFASGLSQVMALWFDRELGYLWAACDNNCDGKTSILEINTLSASPTGGRFRPTRFFTRPTGMANLNTEGFTLAPLSDCVGGVRRAYWADDGNTSNHALLHGTAPCTRWQ